MSGSRINNASHSAQGQFTYAVSIQLLSPENQVQETRGHMCGGALFTLSHVVTTAHCILREIDNVPQPIPALRVFAGSVDLTNDTSPDLVRAVSTVSVHPRYTGPPAFVNDIAVLTLASAFPASAATPLNLPSANFNPPDFTLCTITGWGGAAIGQNSSSVQRYTEKYIYNQNLCMTIYNKIPLAKNILPSMVCAVSLDIITTNCEGDLGNALVCAGTFTGVLSRSDDCQASSLPEIYTRVSNHTAWLRQISGSSAVYAPGVFVLMAVFSLMQVFIKA
ncbi:trypsin delta-like [Bicyclus anynana]|uniref:Trypsin delta-like n=1 Tax=Bicyclus anynana TaxID=110368 RepID=A0ABM3LNF2_BICAN|nr:trypsin delta-like [Bicyclus anynana]